MENEYEWEEVRDAFDEDGVVEEIDLADEEELEVALRGSDLGDASGKQKGRRAITKADRDHAALIHRSSLLCLTARAQELDKAADNPSVQAHVLSMANQRVLDLLDPSFPVQRAINCLQPVLKWFGEEFQQLQTAGAEEDVDALLGPLSRTIPHQVQTALDLRLGPLEALVALFVAFIRASGLQGRVVRLLDGAPLHPWRKRVTALRTMPRSQSTSAAAAAGKQSAAAGATAAGGAMEAGSQAKGRAAKKAKLEVMSTVGGKAAGGPGPPGLPPHPGGSGRAGDASTSKRGGRASGGGKGGSKAAQAKDEKAITSGAAGAAESAEPSPGGAGAGGDDDRAKRNRGEEEFEAQLRMAMMATEAEETARQQARAASAPAALASATLGTSPPGRHSSQTNQGSGPSGSTQQSKGQGAKGQSVRQQLHALVQASGAGWRGRQGAGGGAAGASGAGGSGKANIVVAAPGFSNCWAEVWCGSAESGRWVHVDVGAGTVDRPGVVESGAAGAGSNAAAAGYVVACEHGCVRDVTTRYYPNTLSVKRLRDEQWWQGTLEVIGNSGGAAGGAATGAGAGGPSTAGARHQPGSQAQQQQQSQEPSQAAAPAHSAAAGPLAGAGGAAAGAAGKAQPSGGPGPAGPFSSAPPAAAAKVKTDAAAAAQAQAQAQAAAASAAAAAMRAKREEAELNHREKAGLAGLPTSIEGFKSHPLYVLKRHIAKYEALRPGSHPLGLHKGEPYYAREALSELHTAERWRRLGWKVRDEEMGAPTKVVKKRMQPAPRQAPTSFRYGGGRGRFAGPGGPSKSQPAPPPPRRSGSLSGGLADEGEEGGGEEGEEGGGGPEGTTNDLYGKWQCDPFIAEAKDGKVPRNERGNVEVPPLSSVLPRGCVHLQYPGLGPVCRGLGIDFAPALVGFELQGGRSVPKIDGVVVCEEYEAQVVAAYIERETAREQAAAAKREREARGAWLQLLQALRMRAQLEQEYVEGGAGTGGAADVGEVAAGAGRGGRGGQQGRGRGRGRGKGGGRGAAAGGAEGQQDGAGEGMEVNEVYEQQRQQVMERLMQEEAAAQQQQGADAAAMQDVEMEEI